MELYLITPFGVRAEAFVVIFKQFSNYLIFKEIEREKLVFYGKVVEKTLNHHGHDVALENKLEDDHQVDFNEFE